MMPRKGCVDKCGNISIPFPFGIGTGCFRDGFEVLCNHSRLFLANYGMSTEQPLELMSISVGTGEALAYAGISSRCSTNDTAAFSMDQGLNLYTTPFAVSLTRNVLIGVGMLAQPQLTYDPDIPDVSCLAFSLDAPGDRLYPTNGSCTGRGCCEATLPLDLGPTQYFSLSLKAYDGGDAVMWSRTPCNYGMLVEKSWYSFSTADMYNRTLLQRFPRGVAVALDFAFAVENASCPVAGQPPPPDYACISGNSSCANTTYSTRAPGYICKCLEHYEGNPYVPNGCQGTHIVVHIYAETVLTPLTLKTMCSFFRH
jgi:hypothetical protein